MKADEAPEKIYVEIKHPFSEEYTQMIAFEDGDGIEYIRTDAFIEKAKKYLTGKFIKDVSVLTTGVVSINFNTAISNFVNYMKGE